MAVEICPNCRHDIEENFCPNCGQKKYQRIDNKYIKEEIQYTLLHTNKGFFYTIKCLIKNPGKTTREFLNGKRVKHYKPLLLAFLLSGITTFITYKVLNLGETVEVYMNEKLGAQSSEFDSATYNSFLANYMSLFMMLLIPFAALLSYWVFRKQGNNYFEHIVINAYLYSFWAICTGVVLYPILYFVDSITWVVNLTFLSLPLFFPLTVWFFKELYPDLKWPNLIGKVLLIGILGCIIYLVLSMFIGAAYATYIILNN